MDAQARDGAGAVWPAAIASGALIAQHVAGKATRDTLFLTNFGLTALPAAMIAAAILSSMTVIGISRALTRLGPARLVPITFATGAVLFLLELWLSVYDERAAAIAVYVHTAIFGTASVSAFWSLVNERFDPHEAKKHVSRIASGGTVGGILGGLVVWRAADRLSVPMMLALLAGINVIGLWGGLRTGRGARAPTTHAPIAAGGGTRILKETPYLRNLALLVALGAVVQALLDWLVSAHATHAFGRGAALLRFFAIFNMIVGVASFAAQTGLARPLLSRLGLAETLKLHPIGVAACSALALVAPRLSAVILLRGVEAVIRGSFYRSAYELCYTPLPAAQKRPSKTLIDVGFDRIGTTLGAGALLGVAHLATETATRAVLFGAIALSIAAWLVASRLHVGYVAALAASLKSGAVALDDADSLDLTTRKTLAETTALLDRGDLLARIEKLQREKETRSSEARSKAALAPPAPIDDPLAARAAALRSGDVARVKAALASPLDPALAPFAIPLLADDALARDAVRALRKIAPRATGALLDALLDPAVDPRVRRRVPRVLKVCRTQRAASGLFMALDDPVFDVRVQVAAALAQLVGEPDVTLDREAVLAVALREATERRATWSQAVSASGDRSPNEPPPSRDDELARGLAHVFTVLGLALDREPLRIAYRALRATDTSLRGTAFEYLEVVLPPRLRDVVVPLLGDVKPAPRSRERDRAELAAELLKSSAALARRSS